jgi:hypothetical protein
MVDEGAGVVQEHEQGTPSPVHRRNRWRASSSSSDRRNSTQVVPCRKPGTSLSLARWPPGRITGKTRSLRSPELTRRWRAKRISSLCHGPMPSGPKKTRHVSHWPSASSIAGCQGLPGIRFHSSNQQARPRSSSLAARSLTAGFRRPACGMANLEFLILIGSVTDWL